MSHFSLQELESTVETAIGLDDEMQRITEADLDVPFIELGYDSLSIYALITSLEDSLRIQFTDQDIDATPTPRTLIEFVNQRLSAAEAAGHPGDSLGN